MKKIQLVTYEPSKFNDYDIKIDIRDFNKLEALDNYEINVIDLSSIEIWTNKGTTENKPSLNSKMSSDFASIKKMISNSKKSKIIICLPQNLNYHWKYFDEFYNLQLKDMLSTFSKILSQLIPIEGFNIVYENSTTVIESEYIKASFYFDNDEFEKLTISKDSEKITSISSENIIMTSLNIIQSTNSSILDNYLHGIGLLNDDVEYPEWLYKYSFNDDDIQNNNIQQAKEQIKIQKDIIEQSNKKLQDNLRYKSILYNNSAALVEVVFEIIEYIFDISLSDFNDEKREDFLFKKDSITYIGEIKGVTSNVKYENISQLEVHYSKYLDKLQEEGATEQIKKILIMNYERTKDIILRDDINQMQIDLAIKNSTLIIDSKTLLIIYERLLQGKITKNKIIDYIKSSSGIVDLNKLK